MSAPAIISSGTAAGGPPVGGTGTTNTIPRWTGPSTLGDSGLIDNGTAIYTTTRNVGFGTASPSTRLHVSDNSSIPMIVQSSGSTDSYLRFINTANNLGYIGYIGTNLYLAPNNGAGNVGIGTASPGYKFVVADTVAGVVTSEVRNDSTNSAATTRLQLNTQGGTSWIEAIRNAGGALSFATLSTERARIDSAGNFGIGTGAATTTPAATGSLVIGQNNVSQQWAARIYGGNDANRAPVLSLFRAGNAESIVSQLRDGALNVLGFGTGGGIANFNDATLASYCQVKISPSSMDISGSTYGLKLPATPGNADVQTLDAYQEIGTGTPAEIALTLTCGTSGTITVNAASSKARVTRVGNKVIGHGRIVVSSVSAPLGRLSCVLTGCPQPFTNFLVETQTDNTTGLATGNRIVGTSDTSATPTIYFDRYSANTSSLDAAANIQAGTVIVFNICYSV